VPAKNINVCRQYHRPSEPEKHSVYERERRGT